MLSVDKACEQAHVLQLAGLEFIFSKGLHFDEEVDAAYRSFCFPKLDSSCDAIRVDIAVNSDAPWPAIESNFDTHTSWAFTSQGEDKLWFFRRSDLDEPPYRLVRWSPTANVITITSRESGHLWRDGEFRHHSLFSYPVDQLVLMHLLALKQGVILHAAGLERAGKSLLFPGRSGAGKSTLAACLSNTRTLRLLSDDRMIVRKIDGVYEAFGTPWPGEGRIAENDHAPLEGLYFIEHGEENRRVAIDAQEALARLLPMASIPWHDEEARDACLVFCSELVEAVPLHLFYFKPGTDVAATVL